MNDVLQVLDDLLIEIKNTEPHPQENNKILGKTLSHFVAKRLGILEYLRLCYTEEFYSQRLYSQNIYHTVNYFDYFDSMIFAKAKDSFWEYSNSRPGFVLYFNEPQRKEELKELGYDVGDDHYMLKYTSTYEEAKQELAEIIEKLGYVKVKLPTE